MAMFNSYVTNYQRVNDFMTFMITWASASNYQPKLNFIYHVLQRENGVCRQF